MRNFRVLSLLLSIIVLRGATLFAVELHGTLANGMGWYKASAPVLLSNTANYVRYHGCSPTAAGMMMGYYDRNGYKGQSFANLVPGGVAESTTFGISNPLVNSIIASPGHIADFCTGGDGVSGDDVAAPWHTFNSLADFMGTSQDFAANTNGETMFYYWEDGSRLTPADIVDNGLEGKDGMYGIGQYVNYAGYNVANLYTQLIDSEIASGFTFTDYVAEIEAGRPVLLDLDGHTLLGYGYDASLGRAIVYDTFDPNGQTPGYLTWGGSYAGMDQWGVTVLELESVPEPSTIVLLGIGVFFSLSVYIWQRRKHTRD